MNIAAANRVQRGADLAEEYKMMADGRCPTSPELTELVKAPLKVYFGSSDVTIALHLLLYVGIVSHLVGNGGFKGLASTRCIRGSLYLNRLQRAIYTYCMRLY